jgi:fucose permease
VIAPPDEHIADRWELSLGAPQVQRARTAVLVAFLVNGLVYSVLISRVPALGNTLQLSTGQLGLLLWCLSGGAISGLPLAGPLIQRTGPARAALAGALIVTAGLITLVSALLGGPVQLAALGLYLTGLGMGGWEVAMNVAGADVAQRLDSTSLMTRLHAALSLGTVAGAAIGAACAALGISLAAQLLVVLAMLPLLMAAVVRNFVTPLAESEVSRRGGGLLAGWREPRTLAIGLLVLAFAFTEGSANEWIAYALVTGYGSSESTGAIAFALFVTAMTLGRLLGGSVLARFGRVNVLRAATAVALTGLLAVVFGGSAPVALAGALLWGFGAALGFPVGMSAAADDPARAVTRVSVVSTVGYTAFLAGPPLIGLLGERVGILKALLAVLVALLVALFSARAARPLPQPGLDEKPATLPH